MVNRTMLAQIKQISIANKVILRGYVQLSDGVHAILFDHYCKNTLFYYDLFKSHPGCFRVNQLANRNYARLEKLLISMGIVRIWTKVFLSIVITSPSGSRRFRSLEKRHGL